MALPAVPFLRVDFDGSSALGLDKATSNGRRKFRFTHGALRNASEESKTSIKDLLDDPWKGWPYLIKYGLLESDPKMTLDMADKLIDMWVQSHPDEELPMNSLGQLLREAFEAAGFIRTKKTDDETPPAEAPPAEPEGNAPAG